MGAWIEIQFINSWGNSNKVAPHDGCVDWNWIKIIFICNSSCRTPRWVRGLKSWTKPLFSFLISRTPRWVRGLKFWLIQMIYPLFSCRTPRWVRGLKFKKGGWLMATELGSHPTMGAWIEIVNRQVSTWFNTVAPHDGCVDWNLLMDSLMMRLKKSHPTMGAWIEIILQV